MSTDGDPDRKAESDDAAGPDPLRMRVQELFEFAADGQFLTDLRGLIAEANHAASALLRWPKDFLVGKPLGLLVLEVHRSRFYERLAKLGSVGGSDEFEVRMGRVGDPREIHLQAVSVPVAGDRPAGIRWHLRDLTERRQAESTRVDLLRRLVTAQEDERRRVARELHDSVGQLLTALTLSVRAARDAGPAPRAVLDRLDDIGRVADELARTTHGLAVRLRPTALDDFGLIPALQHHIGEWSAVSGVEVHFQAAGLDALRFGPEIETALYRIAQESLTNVLRHARARLVSLVIERRDGHAIILIEDDGVGYDAEAVVAGGRLGLLGMSDRCSLLGGSFQVESRPEAGTTVRAFIPLDHRDGGHRHGRASDPAGG